MLYKLLTKNLLYNVICYFYMSNLLCRTEGERKVLIRKKYHGGTNVKERDEKNLPCNMLVLL